MKKYFEKARDSISSYTHFLGAVGGVFGIVLLWIRCAKQGVDGLVVAGVTVFGLSLVALYSASSIYHYTLCAAEKLRRLRKLDHAMIYVLIAGTYTPLCIKFINPEKLPLFLGGLWLVALVGMVLKVVWLDAPRWVCTLLYLALGWAIMVDLPAFAAMPKGCFGLVLAGGLFYSVGAVLYALKKPNISDRWGFHELFHLFILAGSVCHFIAIFLYVI